MIESRPVKMIMRVMIRVGVRAILNLAEAESSALFSE
jgi:hypothetical protein